MAAASFGAAKADPVVVELFTSQGCSSCPAADELLAMLADRDDVIPLALHIDYWDYIGWKDAFADPVYTHRQKAYARSGGRNMVYTPQMIIDGMDEVVGNRPMDVADLIAKRAKAPGRDPVDLTIGRTGGIVSISAEAAQPLPTGADVYLVRYSPSEVVNILRGENAGKTLTYSHIVTDWQLVGHWGGQGAYTASVPANGDAPVVVLIQAEGYGPMLAAARIE
ncbi:DUF1223 domain-containing protein [Pseudoprimorskyibacter insulae]|nr:DUF1223 domain-containing protein [Pseudoprimorskyibacter insulae]